MKDALFSIHPCHLNKVQTYNIYQQFIFSISYMSITYHRKIIQINQIFYNIINIEFTISSKSSSPNHHFEVPPFYNSCISNLLHSHRHTEALLCIIYKVHYTIQYTSIDTLQAYPPIHLPSSHTPPGFLLLQTRHIYYQRPAGD